MSTTVLERSPAEASSSDQPVSWLRALISAIALSVVFLVVYGGTNWITSLRSDVGTWYYAWERYIPFVPLFIVPYMSIDAFFFGAPFLCGSRRELRLLSWRIMAAVFVGGLCFLLFPLQLAVERPAVTGWLGGIFDWFRGMDRPYNLCPSLHIALRTILADHYSRHTRGLLRAVTAVWFSLIGLSTLLTYQHHVVDVIGGFILAMCCFYFVQDVPWRLPMVRNSRIGWMYAGAAVVLAALCALAWPWGIVLLWPVVALAIIAAGYFVLGPSIYRKREGRLPLSAKVLLAPVLAGQYLSWLYYKRQSSAWDEVAPGVWIGRRLTDAEAARAVEQGVSAVLDLSNEFSEARPFLAVEYCHLPVLDLTAPHGKQLAHASAFIEEHAGRGTVYVHCKIGYSRSVAVVGAWLIASGRTRSAEDAIAQLRTVRPAVVVRAEVREALLEFARTRSVVCV